MTEFNFFDTLLFTVITLFGMLNFKLISLKLKRRRTLLKKEKWNPSFRYWIDDNALDFIVAFIFSFFTHIFLNDVIKISILIFPEIPVFTNKLFYAYLIGFLFQFVTHKILNNIS